MKSQRPATNQPEPVAYDVDGRPLYHHPPTTPANTPSSHVTAQPESYDGHNFDPKIRAQYANEPKVVHTTRQIEPDVPKVSDELKQRHEKSRQRYPFLNLSEGEYVMMSIRRHPIGLFIPISITAVLVTFFVSFAFLFPDIYNDSASGAVDTLFDVNAMVGFFLIAALLSAVGGFVAVWVYLQNQFFLTNESVIQEIQHSLFSRHEQTVSLGSIEDASFKQGGILQLIFDYGTIRLSTEGEETTYRFAYVSRPKKQVAIVNNAVEAFKNGRPVDGYYDDVN